MNKLPNDIGKTVSEGKQTVIAFVKNKIFDFIGIAVVAAMLALMLNVVEGRPFTLQTFVDVLIQLVPFYVCAMMLSLNYYKKGAYAGKRTDSFESTIENYSDTTAALTGDEIRYLPEFCIEYNENAKKDLQTQILKTEGVEYADYAETYIYMSYSDIKKQKGKAIARVVRRAKRVKVEGVNANILLGSYKSKDITNLGPTEQQLLTGRGVGYALGYVITIGFLTFLVARNIKEWNWMRMLYELVKVIYIFVRSYMRYFEGYEDITIRLSNSINRKTDILKAYSAWYIDKGYSSVDNTKNSSAKTDSEVVTNN